MITRATKFLRLAIAVSLLAFGTVTQAASISLLPASSTVNIADGTATLELFMDFSDVGTLGGGIDFALSGPLSGISFTPSSYFNTETDPFFTGFGTATADADFEIHLGSSDFVNGLNGINKLGDITVALTGTGPAAISLAINTTWGGFIDTLGNPLTVDLNGATLSIVPLPAPFVLLLSSLLGLIGLRRRT